MAIPKIEIIDKVKPKKLEPVSPKNVFAGLKLYGKNPNIAPDKAVTNKIEIRGEPFKAKIISKETQEIRETPLDKPSNPSIKLIAFVIPTIQMMVKTTAVICSVNIVSKNGKETLLIWMPHRVTTIAAKSCPANLTKGLILFKSSMKQNAPRITIP